MSGLQCAALTKGGARCTASAVESTGWWRCRRHEDWYRHATLKERETLALLELAEYTENSAPYWDEDEVHEPGFGVPE